MKRRYSPAARRAHLAHLRAKYGKSAIVQTLPQPEPDRVPSLEWEKEYCVSVQPEPAPMPPTMQYTEYKHLYCEDCGKSICFVPLNDTGHYYFCRSCQRNVRVIEDVAPLSPAEQKEAESADNWAKTIDPPSPPWEGGAA